MSTPICRYYLSNNCRYGDRCRFSHNISDSSYNSNYSTQNPYVLNRTQTHERQGHSESKQNWKQSVSYNDIQEIIERIRDEAKQVEYENLWPLTCLSVLRDAPNVPGWEDYSVEELRSAAYSSKLTGRFDEYVRLYQSLLQKAKENRSIFLRPGKKSEEIVKSMLEKRGQDSGKTSSNFSFAQIPAFGGFGSAAAGATTGSIFGGTTGTATGSSSFGGSGFGSASADPAPGIFAMAAQGFAANASQSSDMNDTAMETASESLLNQSSASQLSPLQQNIFGQVPQKGPFSSQVTPSVFGGAPSTTTNIFGGTSASPNAFGSNPASSSVFGGNTASSAGSSVFGGAPAATSVFGGTTASSPFSTTGSTGSACNSSVYTSLNELSEADLEQFKAATFSLSKLPLVPPPQELC